MLIINHPAQVATPPNIPSLMPVRLDTGFLSVPFINESFASTTENTIKDLPVCTKHYQGSASIHLCQYVQNCLPVCLIGSASMHNSPVPVR